MKIEEKLKYFSEKRTAESNRLGALEFEEKQFRMNFVRRQQILDDFNRTMSENVALNDFLDFLDRKVKISQKNLIEKRNFYEEKEKVLSEKIDRLKGKRIEIESTIKLKSFQVEKNLAEIQQIKQQQKQIEHSSRHFDELNKEIDRREKELEENLSDGKEIDRMKNEIQRDEEKRSQLQSELKNVNEQIDDLLVNGKLNTEREMFNKEKIQRDEQIRKM